MGRIATRELWKWIKIRGVCLSELVFIMKNGEGLNRRRLGKIFQDLGKRANINGVRVSPHTLRHTFATNYIRNGGDVFSLQRILGHRDIQTCMIYVHMGGKVLGEAQLKYSPMDKFGL